jgi:hypothetical protein
MALRGLHGVTHSAVKRIIHYAVQFEISINTAYAFHFD